MTGYKKGAWPQTQPSKQQSLSLCSLQNTGDTMFSLAHCPLVSKRTNGDKKIPGVVGGKVTLNLYHANSRPDLDAFHPHISFQTGNPLHRPPALAGSALHCMRLTSWCLESGPESLPSCQSKFPWKFCSRPQDNVSPVDDFQRYTRKWKRGCLKEAEFCNWEKEIGEINVSVYPLYFCLLWAPFAYSNYLK